MIYICQSKESTYRETPEIALIQIFDKALLDTAPQILTQAYHPLGWNTGLLWHGFKHHCWLTGEGGNHLWYRCSQTLFCSYPNLYCFRSDAPFVTFKRKPEHILKKIKIKKNNVVITTQANEWMDYKLMMHWSARCSWNTQKGVMRYWFLMPSRGIWRRKSLPSWLQTIFLMW